jgi:hypothetical protein
MNIFATDPSPEISARNIDDVRGNKLILESAQMLSSALCFWGYLGNDIYKEAYPNHPCTKWTKRNRSNFLWLCEHAMYLSKYIAPKHSSNSIISKAIDLCDIIPDGKQTPFANCAANAKLKLSFHHLPVHDAYKAYLNARWKIDTIPLTWKNRKPPEWKI